MPPLIEYHDGGRGFQTGPELPAFVTAGRASMTTPVEGPSAQPSHEGCRRLTSKPCPQIGKDSQKSLFRPVMVRGQP